MTARLLSLLCLLWLAWPGEPSPVYILAYKLAIEVVDPATAVLPPVCGNGREPMIGAPCLMAPREAGLAELAG